MPPSWHWFIWLAHSTKSAEPLSTVNSRLHILNPWEVGIYPTRSICVCWSEYPSDPPINFQNLKEESISFVKLIKIRFKQTVLYDSVFLVSLPSVLILYYSMIDCLHQMEGVIISLQSPFEALWKVNGKATAQQLPISFRKRLKSIPSFHYLSYFIHVLYI